jgi:hypothetical protein
LKNAHAIRHGVNFGGADGIRTHDLLDAIEARSQLRHGPTDWNLLRHSPPGRYYTNASIRMQTSSISWSGFGSTDTRA